MKTNTKIGLLIAGFAAWMIAKRKGIAGIGATDEYLIRAWCDKGQFSEVGIFCGFSYKDGEKWAKWNNPAYRYGSEYDEKIFKTRKGAEKAIEELKRVGEDSWNGYPVEFEIITWDEHVRFLRNR